MPAAHPAQIHELFEAAFNAHDVDTILDLYEPGAVFVTGPGTQTAGHAALREVFQGFFALRPTIRLETASVLAVEDLALLEGRWVLMGTRPEGDPVQSTGTSREVVRRQPDGSWRYAIDDPGNGR